MAAWQATSMLDVPASSRASPLPQGFVSSTNIASDTKPVGAWLARDGGVTGDIDVGCAGLFAGKPAPTGFCVVHKYRQRYETCGSVACPRWRCDRRHRCWMCRPLRGQARSHRVLCRPQISPAIRNLWERGLPAMASRQTPLSSPADAIPPGFDNRPLDGYPVILGPHQTTSRARSPAHSRSCTPRAFATPAPATPRRR